MATDGATAQSELRSGALLGAQLHKRQSDNSPGRHIRRDPPMTRPTSGASVP